LKPGDTVLLDEGLIRLEVEKIDKTEILCRVITGGELTSRKGINLPGVLIGSPSLTAKDRKDLALILDSEFDFVALSFVRSPKDIQAARRILKKKGSACPLIAKIEKPEALENLEEILAAADGVMVARGDLGVELSVEKVPAAQKRIIRLANSMDKTVITATQMLESMRFNPIPTRAEASDVANAIFDGTDAVMLSAETATGRYPQESVDMMHRIAVEAEEETRYEIRTPPRSEDSSTFAGAVCDAACQAADDVGAGFLVAETLTGRTARLLSKFRPGMPIIGLTSDLQGWRRMTLYHNVIPLLRPRVAQVEDTITEIDRELKSRGWVRTGDVLVFTFGLPLAGEGHTNALRLHSVR
jgi:pyruvate kinase